jgi:hypothetical protein
MPGPQNKYPIELNEEQVAQLTHLSLSYTAPYCQVQGRSSFSWPTTILIGVILRSAQHNWQRNYGGQYLHVASSKNYYPLDLPTCALTTAA